MINTNNYSNQFAKAIFILFAMMVTDFWQCIPAKAQTTPLITWQQTIGGSSFDQINYVDLTSDGGYILGGYSSSGISSDKTEACWGANDYWAIKVDATGSIEWQNTIGSNDTDGLLVNHQTADGGYILMGFSHSGISADKSESNIGYQDYWVVKLNATGVIEWENTIGGNGGDGGRCLVELSDGGFIIGGFSYSSVSYDQTNSSSGVSDYWVLKINATGSIEWQNTIGGTGYDWMQSVQPTTDGGYIIGGWSDSGISGDKTKASKGGTDYWVVKINSTGSIEWQNVIGGNSDESLSVILQTADDGYVLGGTSKSGISGDKTEASWGLNDYWIVKLNEAGNIEWQKTIGGNNEDYFTSIQLTPDGGYIVGGSSSSDISGNKTTASWGGFDYWLVKLSEFGIIEWQKTIGGSNDDNLNSIQVTGNESYILGGGSASGISGDKTAASKGDFDFWLVKLGCQGINVYGDVDGDGFGNAADSLFVEDCIVPVGYVFDHTDCTDANAFIHPDAEEVINCLDDNCNGIADEGKWIQKANLAGTARYNASGFTIGDKAYIGTGKTSANDYLKDFWEYDPVTNVWTQKANYGGSKRFKATGFAIGTKGYIGTGYDINGSLVKDFWEYDIATNAWTKKANFGGTGRQNAAGFSIGDKGYIGTGGDFLVQHNDFWEYDPATNNWTQKANVSDTLREAAVGFSIGEKGYIGTGSNSNGNKNDFWEYDPTTDTWIQKADFAGMARNAAAGFSVDDKGFIGTGYDGTNPHDDFWQYDPTTDTWKQIANFTGTQRAYAVGFSVSGKGYVTTGGDSSGSAYNDLWQYDAPDFVGLTVYADTDSDGFGDVNDSYFVSDCVIPVGYIADSTDCDDNNASINPAAIEICDGIDNNCDGAVDPLYTFYADADGDGYGNNNTSVTDCAPPSGYVTNNTINNDANAAIHPGATELCNDIDDNCNAQIDEGLLITFYADADGDLYGNPNNSTLACTLPNGYATNNTDCDDTNANVYPGATEILFNGIDDDCDGYVDEFGVGIEEANSASSLKVYPNPNDGKVTIEVNLEEQQSLSIKLFDVIGKEILTTEEEITAGTFSKQLDLSNLPSGTYFLKVIHDGVSEMRKIAIEK